MKPTQKPMRGATAMTAAQNTLTAVRQMSPFVHASDTLDSARGLSQRVLNLAERLLSHYPPPDESASPAASNVLAILDMNCADADVAISRANAALDAIENALP